MAVIKLKPTSPGNRFTIRVKSENLHKGGPYKALTEKKNRTSGRNSDQGRICVRHRGGAHKRRIRLIDFKRTKDLPAKVERIEYDPGRNADIALVCYIDGERRYILAPKGVKAGDRIENGPNADIKVGNCLPLANIPVGTTIHAVEEMPLKGAQIARSAGTSVVIAAREGRYTYLKLPSSEMKRVPSECRATIGEVCRADHKLQVIGKAGRKRWMGIRPTVRGVAMNPVDHPLGGGEGRTSGGRPSCSPTGIPKGKRTRKPGKQSSKNIIRSRHKSKKD